MVFQSRKVECFISFTQRNVHKKRQQFFKTIYTKRIFSNRFSRCVYKVNSDTAITDNTNKRNWKDWEHNLKIFFGILLNFDSIQLTPGKM